MERVIVILGAGIAGFPLTHFLVRHTARKFPDVRVVLVTPTDEFYWTFAIPRAVIPGQLSSSDVSLSITKSLAQYPSDKLELVLGKASKLLPAENSVIVTLNDGGEKRIDYHSIVVATGSDDKHGLPWKNVGTSEETRQALDNLRKAIEGAESIVVAGAGSTGIEFAGELGSEYGVDKAKKLVLISSEHLPLSSNYLDSMRKTAMSELEKMNVRVVVDAKVTKQTTTADGEILEITKRDGTTETMTASLLVPAHGVSYNTEFMPADMCDESRRIKQDKGLRALGYSNIFVIGDAGNLQAPEARHANGHVWHIGKNFPQYMTTGAWQDFKPDEKVVLGLTLGRNRGTGQMGNWKIWSTLIWYLKGRHMGLDRSAMYTDGTGNALGKWN